jgi:hypothetical protein
MATVSSSSADMVKFLVEFLVKSLANISGDSRTPVVAALAFTMTP